jgi:predicted transcriptional regulator
MTPKLTVEQRDALKQQGSPLPVEDEQTHQVYFLVDKVTLESADRDAIRRGIADMEAGRVLTLEELDARIQRRIRAAKSA